MYRTIVGAAILAAAWSGVAAAQTVGGWSLGQPYVRGDVGAAFGADTHFRDTDPNAPNALLWSRQSLLPPAASPRAAPMISASARNYRRCGAWMRR